MLRTCARAGWPSATYLDPDHPLQPACRHTVAELAALYEQGTAWCTDLAYGLAPSVPEAWDPRFTADAAFGRYLRGATDYAGGKV